MPTPRVTEIWVDTHTVQVTSDPLTSNWAPTVPARTTSLPRIQRQSLRSLNTEIAPAFASSTTLASQVVVTPYMTESEWFGQPSFAPSISSHHSSIKASSAGEDVSDESDESDKSAAEVFSARRNNEFVGSSINVASLLHSSTAAILPVAPVASAPTGFGSIGIARPRDMPGTTPEKAHRATPGFTSGFTTGSMRVVTPTTTPGLTSPGRLLSLRDSVARQIGRGYRAIVLVYERHREKIRSESRRRELAKYQNKPLPEIPKPLPLLPSTSIADADLEDESVRRPGRDTFGVECRWMNISLD